jgi:hypothetical protein
MNGLNWRQRKPTDAERTFQPKSPLQKALNISVALTYECICSASGSARWAHRKGQRVL